MKLLSNQVALTSSLSALTLHIIIGYHLQVCMLAQL